MDLTRLSQIAGYHGGLSLNALAGLLAEPYERLLPVLDELVTDKYANPFGCAVTLCPIWYIRGISRDWDQYGGNSYGMSRTGQPILDYTTVYNEAVELAKKYPGKAFVGAEEPTVQELVRVRDRLGIPIILEPQSEGSCLLCSYMTGPARTRPTAVPMDDPFDDDEEEYDGDNEPEDDEYYAGGGGL